MAASRLGRLLGGAFDKIIKNASWRKQSELVSHCKAVQDKLAAMPQQNQSSQAPETLKTLIVIRPPGCCLFNDRGLPLSASEAELFLRPLIMACESASPKIVEPAIDCVHKLIVHSHIQGDIDSRTKGSTNFVLFDLIECVCKCHDLDSGNLELPILKTLLAAVTSKCLHIHGECLLQVAQTFYDIILGSRNVVNQITAKACLIELLVYVFHRMEADNSTVMLPPNVPMEYFENTDDKLRHDPHILEFVQNFISMVIEDIEGALTPVPLAKSPTRESVSETPCRVHYHASGDGDEFDAKYLEHSIFKDKMGRRRDELDRDMDCQTNNVRQRDGLLLFREICKISMRGSSQEPSVMDQILLQETILSLEMIKLLLENAGPVFKRNPRFLGTIKQYLCLSILKNSTVASMNVFELLCSIFMNLMTKFRTGLKAEIGVFFPMLILRVLENTSKPSAHQKTIVLQFLDKVCQNFQILADIFVNYDCDVESTNIFERTVNGLLKTAQGVNQGAVATLTPAQDASFKEEAIKILAYILQSMGVWMNKQFNIPDLLSSKHLETGNEFVDFSDTKLFSNTTVEDIMSDVLLSTDSVKETSDASTFEQRRAYKLELQEGISLFNRRPSEGIEFLIKANKLTNTPEDIAAFLKTTTGLDLTMVGDYLGEREGLALKVMHAYVDSFNFEGMEFDEAIRHLLEGFRLPGEAQKIDRIMEKFAECYCKCNPGTFTSADTAYVLAYSVIMLNTDAHNPMVKSKMSKADFIRNNRGIDSGKDLPEDYLASLYNRIVKNEIKMKADSLPLPNIEPSNGNKLGLDSILNLVIRKRTEEKTLEKADDLIRHMQEQLKAKAGKAESTFYIATDVEILRFMLETCWAPMLAAFSLTLGETDNDLVIQCCLEGFCNAIHVTAAMAMKTQRNAFVTTLAKFTSLHSPADIKQKNIDAIKSIIRIADEYGNYLHESWENVLTCISRIDYIHILGEGVPSDATFLGVSSIESDKSTQAQSVSTLSLKWKGSQQPIALPRRNSSSAGANSALGKVTTEQMQNLVSNFHILEQLGSFEMNRVFAHSEKLNSEAIIDFVKALCKVSIEELRFPSDPRVFSLTKIVEIAHYNMNRIRVVWSGIWNVLSSFFVTVGCSQNLAIAIFAMDSLRQLAMKFLEREELSNYNFQSEFMKPFVIVMEKSTAIEIRELIIRCVSQMVLGGVKNVKSGWKSIFKVFMVAAKDDRKTIVLLAFETIEKIVRDYFPYITETDASTFTDCVNCLIAFTNTKFNNEVSLNAIAFLRFCALRLAEGGVVSSKDKERDNSGRSIPSGYGINVDVPKFTDKDDHLFFWIPLLVGFSQLSFDPRHEIQRSSLRVLSDTLQNHGHLFSPALWNRVFESVLFPIFDHVWHRPTEQNVALTNVVSDYNGQEEDSWNSETSTLALQLLVDIFVKFYHSVSTLLEKVLELLSSFVKQPTMSMAGIGISGFVRIMNTAGNSFSEGEWKLFFHSLRILAGGTSPELSQIARIASLRDSSLKSNAEPLVQDKPAESNDNDELEIAISEAKCHTSVQLLLVEAIIDTYIMHRDSLSAESTKSILDILFPIAAYAHKVNSDYYLRIKLLSLSSATKMPDPPLLELESKSYQALLKLLQSLALEKQTLANDIQVEAQLLDLFEQVLKAYIEAATNKSFPDYHHHESSLKWKVQFQSSRSVELATRAPTVVETFNVIGRLRNAKIDAWLSRVFPLLSNLISCEHGSVEVQAALSQLLTTWIGPILLES